MRGGGGGGGEVEGLGLPERCKIFIAFLGLLKYHIFRNVVVSSLQRWQ